MEAMSYCTRNEDNIANNSWAINCAIEDHCLCLFSFYVLRLKHVKDCEAVPKNMSWYELQSRLFEGCQVNVILWIPLDSAIFLINSSPPDSNLSDGWRYPPLKQIGHNLLWNWIKWLYLAVITRSCQKVWWTNCYRQYIFFVAVDLNTQINKGKV